MNQYIVMKKNNQNQWVLLHHTAYRSEEQARKVIDDLIDQIVIRALNDAVRMHSAVRGVNREKFVKMQDDVLNARKGFKIVTLKQGGWY
jgi:hypothetical protein